MKTKKLAENLSEKANPLTRSKLKGITGGNVPPTDGGDNCFKSYFAYLPQGCGIYHCFSIDTTPPLPPDGSHNCNCYFELQAPYPCAFA